MGVACIDLTVVQAIPVFKRFVFHKVKNSPAENFGTASRKELTLW